MKYALFCLMLIGCAGKEVVSQDEYYHSLKLRPSITERVLERVVAVDSNTNPMRVIELHNPYSVKLEIYVECKNIETSQVVKVAPNDKTTLVIEGDDDFIDMSCSIERWNVVK